MIWTAIVENTTTGVIHTAVFHADYSGKLAIQKARKDVHEDSDRVICILKGDQSKILYADEVPDAH